MCGIFGFAKSEKLLSSLERFKVQGAVMDLMILNEARGKDGTGIFQTSRHEMTVFKEAKPASALLKTKRMRKMIRQISDETLILLGHTRMATVGDVSTKNCHPFLSKDFAGVHNGHFTNREELLGCYRAKQETDVDSEAVFRVLDGSESADEISMRLSQMKGDFALAFVKKRNPHTVYLVRNVRPIYASYVPELNGVFWSSEKLHLQYALSRNFLKGVKLDVNDDLLYEIDVRALGRKFAAKRLACKMEYPLRETPSSSPGGESQAASNPYLFTYDELRQMGYLEDSGLSERSKLSCSRCGERVEAGKLYYDEVSGGSFCDSCSFDYLSEIKLENENLNQERIQHGIYELV